MSEIPEECKYIETCTRSVDADYFEHICSAQSWIHCDWIKPEDLRAYQKLPSKWKLLRKRRKP